MTEKIDFKPFSWYILEALKESGGKSNTTALGKLVSEMTKEEFGKEYQITQMVKGALVILGELGVVKILGQDKRRKIKKGAMSVELVNTDR